VRRWREARSTAAWQAGAGFPRAATGSPGPCNQRPPGARSPAQPLAHQAEQTWNRATCHRRVGSTPRQSRAARQGLYHGRRPAESHSSRKLALKRTVSRGAVQTEVSSETGPIHTQDLEMWHCKRTPDLAQARREEPAPAPDSWRQAARGAESPPTDCRWAKAPWRRRAGSANGSASRPRMITTQDPSGPHPRLQAAGTIIVAVR